TATTVSFGIPLPTVGDMGTLPSSLPLFRLPNLPFNLQTLQLILPVALSLSAVGLLESFLTMSALDDMTNTSNNYGGQKNGDQKNDPKSDPNNDPENNQKNDPNKDARAQGAANLVTGLLGGMAGGATMGPSMINFQTGGRQRLSMLSAGIFLLFFVLVMRQWISLIPTAALVSVMFMVSFRTFDRDFLASLRQRPARETVVVVATVISAVATGNLAVGMIVGIALSV
ncbi:MAG: SulP family inorganic anion transporter, partial [Cyanobacteria bacterium J06573_11]